MSNPYEHYSPIPNNFNLERLTYFVVQRKLGIQKYPRRYERENYLSKYALTLSRFEAFSDMVNGYLDIRLSYYVDANVNHKNIVFYSERYYISNHSYFVFTLVLDEDGVKVCKGTYDNYMDVNFAYTNPTKGELIIQMSFSNFDPNNLPDLEYYQKEIENGKLL